MEMTHATGAIDRAENVREGEELDLGALEAYLREHLPGAAGPIEIEQFPRGFSNLTYLLRLGERELVLRRPPFGAKIKSAHDMGREFTILSGLIRTYPKVPRPLLYCDDESVIGAPFYVMERVRGIILRNRPPEGLALAPERMRGICRALIETLVELHAVDYRAAGLEGLARPEGYVARQVTGWTGRYRRAETDEVEGMDRAAEWLAANLPPERGAVLIHNDFRYDNVVLDPADPTLVVAVLDWEMATIGDPWMDVGTTLGYWAEPGDPAPLLQFGLTALPGNLDRRQWVESYAERSGRELPDPLFYYVYGLFKIGVIVQQIYARYRQGHTRDPRFAQLIHVVRACGDMATRALERGRIERLYG
jgi:aminoglycoside phosphotransferase (APT) family kinase protein